MSISAEASPPVTRSAPVLLKETLKQAGIKLVVMVPERWLVRVEEEIRADPDLRLIQVAREEEGVGVCCGAYMGGMKAALMMENTGFLLSGCALSGLAWGYQIPFLILPTDRGGLEETEQYGIDPGEHAGPMVDVFGFKRYTIASVDQLPLIPKALNQAILSRRPAVCFLGKNVLFDEGDTPGVARRR